MRMGKAELMDIIIEHKKAFSLRDEIGECPNIKIDIDVIDDSTFFVRPFPISEEDKPIMDWQMQRLVSLGILTRNTTSHTSPVMLITRKLTRDKRPVVDFRLLNTRLLNHVCVSPLEDDTVCNLLQLSKFSPTFNKHSISRFTGYDYEHVVYWITVFFLKFHSRIGLQISQKILWK